MISEKELKKLTSDNYKSIIFFFRELQELIKCVASSQGLVQRVWGNEYST